MSALLAIPVNSDSMALALLMYQVSVRRLTAAELEAGLVDIAGRAGPDGTALARVRIPRLIRVAIDEGLVRVTDDGVVVLGREVTLDDVAKYTAIMLVASKPRRS